MHSALLIFILSLLVRPDASGNFALPTTTLGIENSARINKEADTAKVSIFMETETLAKGVWGGQQVRLLVGESSTEIEFGCAHGLIDRRIEVDNEGRFDVPGTYEDEAAGPVKGVTTENQDRATESSVISDKVQQARYTGQVGQQKMNLTVTLTKTGRVIGTFSLTLGATLRMHKCH